MTVTISAESLASDLAHVARLVAADPLLQATTWNSHTVAGRLWIKVDGSIDAAAAWHAAIGGRAWPWHSDRYGVRRKTIIGSRVSAEITDDSRRNTLSSHSERRNGMGSPVSARGHSTGGRQQPSELVPVAPTTGKGGAVHATVGTAPPPQLSRAGAIRIGTVLVAGTLGLSAFGGLTSAGRPNGATLLVVVVVGAILYVVSATFRGYWVQESTAAAYTDDTVKTVKQNTSADHFQDAA